MSGGDKEAKPLSYLDIPKLRAFHEKWLERNRQNMLAQLADYSKEPDDWAVCFLVCELKDALIRSLSYRGAIDGSVVLACCAKEWLKLTRSECIPKDLFFIKVFEASQTAPTVLWKGVDSLTHSWKKKIRRDQKLNALVKEGLTESDGSKFLDWLLGE